MQCMLCGCKFDLEEASKCECNCAFGGCGGQNVKCPNCGKGVLVKRSGRNGEFWGCSNYPRCKMTCNDKDGQPDLEDAQQRLQRMNSKK